MYELKEQQSVDRVMACNKIYSGKAEYVLRVSKLHHNVCPICSGAKYHQIEPMGYYATNSTSGALLNGSNAHLALKDSS